MLFTKSKFFAYLSFLIVFDLKYVSFQHFVFTFIAHRFIIKMLRPHLQKFLHSLWTDTHIHHFHCFFHVFFFYFVLQIYFLCFFVDIVLYFSTSVDEELFVRQILLNFCFNFVYHFLYVFWVRDYFDSTVTLVEKHVWFIFLFPIIYSFIHLLSMILQFLFILSPFTLQGLFNLFRYLFLNFFTILWHFHLSSRSDFILRCRQNRWWIFLLFIFHCDH